jgi:hypothetical protein
MEMGGERKKEVPVGGVPAAVEVEVLWLRTTC